MTALVHDPAVLNDPDFAETVLAPVRLFVEKESALGDVGGRASRELRRLVRDEGTDPRRPCRCSSYEVMAAWETLDLADQAPYMRDFAQIWRKAEKIVYSSTLESPTTEVTRIERQFDPDVVRPMKAGSDADIAIGGPNLAAHAFKAGLIDECNLYIRAGPRSAFGSWGS
jgi:hypothetical protein